MGNGKYALFGATGAVGKALATKLAEQRHSFRVIGRSEERLRKDFGRYEPLVEYCAADLSDSANAARAAAGVDTIFYTVGVPYPQFEQHPKLSRVALAAAAAAGVRHFVHVSTVYPYGVPQQEFVSESHPRNPKAFKGRMRKEQEDLVLAANNPKGMRTTILRAPDFYGPDAELSYVRAIFDAALKGGTANVIGPIDTPHEFIFVPDLAETLIALSEKEEAYGKAWNIAGPGLITTRQFAGLVFDAVLMPTSLTLQYGLAPKLKLAAAEGDGDRPSSDAKMSDVPDASSRRKACCSIVQPSFALVQPVSKKLPQVLAIAARTELPQPESL